MALNRSGWHGERIDWSGYAFLFPFLLPFVLFSVVAVAFGVVVAFTDWRIIGTTNWLGLDNFEAILSDPFAANAFINTVKYGLFVVPSVTLIGFVGALFANQRWPGSVFVRFAIYAPATVSATVIGLVWVALLDSQGFLNQVLGIDVPWLTSTDLSLVSVSIATVWAEVGLAFVLFLAALQTIDKEVREAADLDGASGWQSTRYIVLPLLRPAITLVITLETIAALRIFSLIHLMTGGGPAGSSASAVDYMYSTGILRGRFGYASAVGLVLFVLVLAITLIHRRLIREERPE